MPASVRDALQGEGRAAFWAVKPQDSRIAALGAWAAEQGDDPIRARLERLEAAQNLSEARALLIARQLELVAGRFAP